MAWKTQNNLERTMAEINITPLTDVMLVLLVVFMVTTPLIMVESFKVRLPKAVTAGAEAGKGVIVAVSDNGMMSVNGKTLQGADALYAEFKREFSAPGSVKTVVVKADGATQHRVIVNILDTAKLAGAEKLSIATEHENKK